MGQLFLIFMIYGEEEAIVAPVVCPQLLHLTLKDPGLLLGEMKFVLSNFL